MVTNKKDKERFLGKLKTLSDECGRVYEENEVRTSRYGHVAVVGVVVEILEKKWWW